MSKRGSAKLILAVGLLVIVVASILFFSLKGNVSLSPPSETHAECVNNLCTIVEGAGRDECFIEGSFCGCADTDITDEYSEGINAFLQGTTRNSSLSKTDKCSSITGNLLEYHCENNDVKIFEVDCQTLGNYSCQSGACVAANQRTEPCKDFDNGLNYFLDSSARNETIVIEDYCLEDGRLAEAYCQPGMSDIFVDIVDCRDLGNYTCQLGACVRV